MNNRKQSKREAILDKAAEVFRESGFDGASMATICARVGGSKATLYSYFPSKDELFFEVMLRSSEAAFLAVYDSIDPHTDDIATALHHFGIRYLDFLYSPEIRAGRHLAIAESGRTELGRLLYQRGVSRSRKLLSDFLQAAMDKGKLRQANPDLVARQLYALLEAELIDHFLFRLTDHFPAGQIEEATTHALDVFMAAYGPSCGQPTG